VGSAGSEAEWMEWAEPEQWDPPPPVEEAPLVFVYKAGSKPTAGKTELSQLELTN
jgi:hypothetical protein